MNTRKRRVPHSNKNTVMLTSKDFTGALMFYLFMSAKEEDVFLKQA